MINTEIIDFEFGSVQVKLCVPNNNQLFTAYHNNNNYQLFTEGNFNTFPYWAKVWHSAIALSKFLVKNKTIIINKIVLELAAGLGLPSIVASKFAKNIISTDYINDALFYINESIKINNLENIGTQNIDWNDFQNNIHCDVLIMSDVNYDVKEFEVLFNLCIHYLQLGTTIIIATPQRLIAKPFIEKLLVYCKQNIEYEIDYNEEVVFINLLVLKN